MMDYSLLAQAIEYYEGKGYTYIDVPWAVPDQYLDPTRPENAYTPKSPDGNSLVGSAEQSFLYLAATGKLQPHTHYVACTPCFRDEPKFDALHHPYFMKVELFVHRTICHLKMLQDAQIFLISRDVGSITLEQTSDTSHDLSVNGIEVGSYGWRHAQGIGLWTYGTGLALPRFEQAIEAGEEK